MIHTAALLAAILPLSNAYRLTFYAGFDCNGERLESRQAIQDDTCYDPTYLGSLTSSVTIEREDGDDPASLVVFYPDNVECDPSQAISTANTGCVNVYQDGSFGGYNVISGQSKRRAVQGNDPIEPAFTLGITHGDFFEMDGELWRWKQLSQEAFTGVKPEDWAGEARVASFAPLEYGRDFPFNFTEYDLNNPSPDLAKRADVGAASVNTETSPNAPLHLGDLVQRQDVCRRIRDCVYGFPILANYYFPAQTEAAVNQINAAKPAAQSIWEFLKNPYIAGPIVSLGSGVIGARYFPSCPTCTPDCLVGPDAQAVRTTINEGITRGAKVSATATEIFSDHGSAAGSTLATIIVPPNERGTGICNTPVTDPTPGRFALSRHKRALYANVPGFEEWVETKNFAI